MKIVLLIMSILICFLIYLVVYFWLDRNFYREISKIWQKCYGKADEMAEKNIKEWHELCTMHNKDWKDICYKNNLEWAKICSELQEENIKLKNQLAEREEKNAE